MKITFEMIKDNVSDYNQFIFMFNAGKFSCAIEIGTKLTEQKPDDALVWKILAVCYYQVGNYNSAITATERCIKITPKDPELYSNVSLVYDALGDYKNAIGSLTIAVSINPNYYEAYNNLSVVYYKINDYKNAVIFSSKSLEIKTDYFKALNNLGNALLAMGDINGAEHCYRKSIEVSPAYAPAYNNLGKLFLLNVEYKKALNLFEYAQSVKPGYLEAMNNAGIAYRLLKEYSHSDAVFSKILGLKPTDYNALTNYGLTLYDLGRYCDAKKVLSKAIDIEPNKHEAYNNISLVYLELGRYSEAEANCRHAVKLSPKNPKYYNNLANILRAQFKLHDACAEIKRSIDIDPKFADAHSNHGNILLDLRDYIGAIRAFKEACALTKFNPSHYSNLIFASNYLDDDGYKDNFVEVQKYGALIGKMCTPKYKKWLCNENKRIRVGFVSGDFKFHPVAFFSSFLFKSIDRKNFEIYAFSSNPNADAFTYDIQTSVDEFVPIYCMSDTTAAEAIYNRRIDILIDLSGHTAGNRLPIFGYKPAPVQISWLGYFSTTGVAEIDYFIGDPLLSPIADQTLFIEEIVNLPKTWFCFRPPDFLPRIVSPPSVHNGFITFGSFSNIAKVNPALVDLWATILKSVNNSVMVIKAKQLADPQLVKNLTREFHEHGIQSSRLKFEGYTDREEYFKSYNNIDIVLDTYPYPGGTTTVEAICMGVPVLTLKGNRFLSRLGVTILSCLSMHNFIADNKEDYIKKAIYFSRDIDYLKKIRFEIREKFTHSPLGDTKQFVEDFADMLLDIYERKKIDIIGVCT